MKKGLRRATGDPLREKKITSTGGHEQKGGGSPGSSAKKTQIFLNLCGVRKRNLHRGHGGTQGVGERLIRLCGRKKKKNCLPRARKGGETSFLEKEEASISKAQILGGSRAGESLRAFIGKKKAPFPNPPENRGGG